MQFSISAICLASHDFRVVLMARNQETLDGYVQEFQAQGIECYGIAADAADTGSLTTAFETVQAQFGVVDVLVYNAAILTPGTPTALSSEELMKHYQVDVASALHCANLVLPAQVEARDGAILFTGGGFALYPQAEYTCVSIDKAALRGLAFAMNQELKEKGVYVGVVTIMGNVAVGTHYDPALIAKEYWKLYTDRGEVEFIFK
ncbi:MAG: SDR family oxidoreductase [Oscillospiraceae bacterium]|nr:SDR family oxidoreductase [Oscillospiraceae bacterium]